MRFFIGDYHNGDKGSFIYDCRNQIFENLVEMHDAIVENTIKTVRMTDELYILGDIGDIDILGELPGQITVVAGNHDNVDEIRRRFSNIEVSRHPIMVGYLWLSHEPIGYMPIQCPYLNIHAHTHYLRYLGPGETWDEGNRYFCCSVDQPNVNYTPISEEKIAEILKFKKNEYTKIRPLLQGVGRHEGGGT